MTQTTIIHDAENEQFVCSTPGAAYLLDVPIRVLWREYIEQRKLHTIYLPDGGVEVLVPFDLVVHHPLGNS